MSATCHRRSIGRLLSLAVLLGISACGPELDVNPGGAESASSGAESASSGAESASSGASVWVGTGARLRIMAANISSGNYQSYDPGHGIRIFQGVKPDIVLIQEWNYKTNTAGDIRSFVDTTFGRSFYFYREGGAQIPNGIISRYPILEFGEWKDPYVSNRDFAWARIDIPGPIDLWAVSVHFLTSSSTARNNEATQLVSYIQSKVPPGDFLVIGGDFNSSSRREPCVATLNRLVVAADPYPVDRNGNGNTNASRAKPYDWVLVNAGLSAYKTPTLIGTSSFADGLVLDSRVYAPISEISPVLPSDSAAVNMQHMAVIRDFLIPGESSVSN